MSKFGNQAVRSEVPVGPESLDRSLGRRSVQPSRGHAAVADPVRAMAGHRPRQALLDLLLADRGRFVDVAHRILKCRARAEDVVQDAALRVWQNAPEADVRSPAAYLNRMIRNLAIDAVRQVGLECRLFAPIDDAENAASPCSCPLERMEACQALKAAFVALDRAPARTRNAILAHRLDGVPQKTIAAENGVSPTLVNFMIRDATALCREALEGRPLRQPGSQDQNLIFERA